MPDTPFGRDVLVFGVALLFAMCAAFVATRSNSPESPVWPIRLWLWLFRNHAITWFKRYPEKRNTFSRREQFLATFFIWFFVAFAIGAAFLSCSYRTGCQ
jgi:hypothetical protein